MSVSDEDIEKMKAKIKSELEPFTNKIITIPQTDLVDFKRDYMKFDKKCTNSIALFLTFGKPDTEKLHESIKEQVFSLYRYLAIVESVGNIVVDMLIMLLVANGKDFHIESIYAPRIRHVYSLDDLEKVYVPLKMKLEFLNYYGIKTVPSIIDSKLRNDIAHFNFEKIMNKIIIRGKEVDEVVNPNLKKIYWSYPRSASDI